MHTLATRRPGFLRLLAIFALALTFLSLAPEDASAQYRVRRGGRVGVGRGYYGQGYGGYYAPRVYGRGYGGYYAPRAYSRGYGGIYGYPYARPYASPLLTGPRVGFGYGGYGYGGGYPY
jgi:hypothetical protein